MTIATQSELNALYLDAWDDKFVSVRHSHRCTEMMHFAHEAERNPEQFEEMAAQAEAYEAAFQQELAQC